MPQSRSGCSYAQFGTIAAIVLYVMLFLVRIPDIGPASFQEALRAPRRVVEQLIHQRLTPFPSSNANREVRSAIFLLAVGAFVPWLAAWGLGRGRAADLGTRRPNRYGWRVFLLAFLLSIPFLLWMVQSATIARPYLAQWRRCGPAVFCIYYLINMFTEHFLLHGVVLGLCRAELRWPESIPDHDVGPGGRDALVRLLRWIGMARPTAGSRGARAALRWLGVPPGCVAAMITSALLFGLIHLGKNERELVLSFPGGLAQAYLAYRTNTWLTPFVLHLATAATAMALMLAMQ